MTKTKRYREASRSKKSCWGYQGDNVTPKFESLSQAARWIQREQGLSSAISSIVMKISQSWKTGTVCYGYRWEVIDYEDPTQF